MWLGSIWRQNAKHPQYLQPRKGNFRRKTIIKSFVIFLNTTHSSVEKYFRFFCKITLSQHIYFVAISVNRFHWQDYLLKTFNCQQNEFGVNFCWIYIILTSAKTIDFRNFIEFHHSNLCQLWPMQLSNLAEKTFGSFSY